ncbi:MAG: YggS family pyridoxal phosphate-dependent enzyme [Bacteroidota bacterium]|nr:YggS family pyridoxal phosphate-dependent enzyme [Bacteroidota bacterium]
MSIEQNLIQINSKIPNGCTLVIVTKNRTIDEIKEVYNLGYRVFGENRVQDLVTKYEKLPKDIQWHLIGHLQTNKVKYIAPFISMIHSVESFKLLEEINKQALKHHRIIPCLLQIYIASEETKFGLSQTEAMELLISRDLIELRNIKIVGMMGMATNTTDENQIKSEFKSLKTFFEVQKNKNTFNINLEILSMGMSSDYQLAIAEGSNMVRVGSAVFI